MSTLDPSAGWIHTSIPTSDLDSVSSTVPPTRYGGLSSNGHKNNNPIDVHHHDNHDGVSSSSNNMRIEPPSRSVGIQVYPSKQERDIHPVRSCRWTPPLPEAAASGASQESSHTPPIAPRIPRRHDSRRRSILSQSLRTSVRHLHNVIDTPRTKELYFWTRKDIQVWHTLVGLLALLDFTSNWNWSTAHDPYYHIPEKDSKHRIFFFSLNRHNDIHSGLATSTLKNGTFMSWLALNRNQFGLLFSLVWLIDAIVVAKCVRAPRCKKQQQNGTTRRSSWSERDEKEAQQDCNGAMGLWGIYVRVLTFHLLLMPLSFYVQLYKRYQHLIGYHFSDTSTTAVWPESFQQWRTLCHISDDEDQFHRSIVLVTLACILTQLWVQSQAMKLSWIAKLRTFLLRSVVLAHWRQPRLIWKYVWHILLIIRWSRYLLPLLGALGNLVGRIQEFRKRQRQRAASKLAQHQRAQQLQTMSETQLQNYCARRIQSAFRSKQCRKVLCAIRTTMLMWHNDPEHLAALKLQKPLRLSLDRARQRLQQKYSHVQTTIRHWQQEHQQQLAPGKDRWRLRRHPVLSQDDRQYLYQVEKDLQEEGLRLLNHTLLIAPHSRFTAVWNSIMVFNATLEMIATLVVACRSSGPHQVAPASDPNAPNRRILQGLLTQALSLTPVSHMPQCHPEDFCNLSGPPWQRQMQRIRCGLGRVQRQLHWWPLAPLGQQQAPWYCSPTVSMLQKLCNFVLQGGIATVLTILSLCSVLDVAVKFFIADVDTTTGTLQPAPFVTRWLVPGLLLQLIVNPQLESTRLTVQHWLTRLAHNGPYRVFCWVVALFYPVTRTVTQYCLQVWIHRQVLEAVVDEPEKGVKEDMDDNNCPSDRPTPS